MQTVRQLTDVEHVEPRVGRSVSIEQAAQLLGVSRRTVYNRIRDGKLQTIRTLGGSQRVLMTSLDEIRRFIDAHPALRRPFYGVPHRHGMTGTAAQFVLHVSDLIDGRTRFSRLPRPLSRGRSLAAPANRG